MLLRHLLNAMSNWEAVYKFSSRSGAPAAAAGGTTSIMAKIDGERRTT